MEQYKGSSVPDEMNRLFMDQITEALRFLHKLNIRHGDLKPANILIAKNNRDQMHWQFKICDLGLAKHATKTVCLPPGQPIGSPGYIPPEGFKSKDSKVHPNSDLWSLGVILYEMVMGKPLLEDFQEDCDNSRIMAFLHIIEPYVERALATKPEIDAGLKDLILNLLKQQNKRLNWLQFLTHPYVNTNVSSTPLPHSDIKYF